MLSPPTSQLSLGVSLDDNATFENFLISARNQQALACIADAQQRQPLIALWGADASGRTHLLQAACHQSAVAGQSTLYLPMAERAQLHPEILEGVNTLALVCIDDVELVAGDALWEAALFTAFNAIRESHTQLILAANCAPGSLQMQLPDLQSRLQSCLVFQISELNDAEKLQALQLRARNRGMEMSDAVADYILQRAGRSLQDLMLILDQLDEATLAQQRRLTIPLVKSTLGW